MAKRKHTTSRKPSPRRAGHRVVRQTIHFTNTAPQVTADAPAKQKRKPVSQYDLYPLPFFDGTKREPSTWNVKPSGDYAADCETGRAYALQFMQTADGTVLWGSLLGQIVADMVRAGISGEWPNGRARINGVVIGFMGVIGRAINSPDVSNLAMAKEALRAIEDRQLVSPTGFAPNLPLADALREHRLVLALVKTAESNKLGDTDEAAFSRLCAIERNALRAVELAAVTTEAEAAERVVYLDKYWREYGGETGEFSEGEAAFPSLSPAIQSLAAFSGKAGAQREMQNLTTPLAVAHAAWIAAHRNVTAADAAPERFNDGQFSAVVQTRIDAERALLTTPAADLPDIRLRAAIVAQVFADAEDIGPPTDGRHLKMLWVLLREIMEYQPS